MAEYIEPTWGEGQVINKEPSSLCFTMDPYILTGVFLQFTRSHFFDSSSIVNEKLKGYLWKDDETTRIQIEPSYKWLPTVTEDRPAIYFKREKVSVNNNVTMGQGAHLSHFESNGNHTGVDFTNFIRGGHTIICVGQSAGEAENLGLEIFFRYLEYKKPLKKEANLGTLSVGGISPVQQVAENKENWLVYINLSWVYAHNWTLYQEAPILKKVNFTTAF